jgi:hypothetical protein
VVVDDRLDVVEAGLGLLVLARGAHCSTVGLPAATGRDAPEFLDVHVDQLGGPVAVGSDGGGLRGPDQLAGQRAAVVQSWHAVASQDPSDRARRDTNLLGQLVGPTAKLASSGQHLLFDVRRGLLRARVQSRRAVLEALGAGLVEAIDPEVPRDT